MFPTDPRRPARDVGLLREELSVPAHPLLSKRDELRIARRVRGALSRLRQLVPRHPHGYLLLIERMEAAEAGVRYVPWTRLKARLGEDAGAARSVLERARTIAARDPNEAVRLLERGAEILQRYPLHPETLHDWARAARSGHREDPLQDLERTGKVSRLLRRIVGTLERERDRLATANLRLVLHEAFRYPAGGLNTSDLFQDGCLGLQKAVFRFDPERGLRFSTYATYWIRMSIRKALTDTSTLIRVPQFAQEKLRRESSDVTDEDYERIRRCLSAPTFFSSLLVDRDTSFEPRELTAPEDTDALHFETVPDTVGRALRRLNEVEQNIVKWRFGLGGGKQETLEQIASRVNLSRERVRQIAKRALEKMRHHRDLRDTFEELSLAGTRVA